MHISTIAVGSVLLANLGTTDPSLQQLLDQSQSDVAATAPNAAELIQQSDAANTLQPPDWQPLILAQDASGITGNTFIPDSLRQELLITPLDERRPFQAAAPGSTAGTPTAYGAAFRDFFIGGGGTIPFEDEGRVDGSMVVGFGLGDPTILAAEIPLNITSVGGDFGDSGFVGFKLHRFFADAQLAIAAGWANPIKFGDAEDEPETIYGVITRPFFLRPNNPNNLMPLTVSVGVGTGDFRSKGAINADDNDPNIFGSLGLQLIPQLSLVGSWTGSELNLGASAVPFRQLPFVINTIFTDVTSNLETGTGFTVSGGIGFSIR
ncbi:MAG: hypothetical protein AAGF24_10145 [Cyanobacteria bacterium P01_H01_bin.121]